MAEAQVIDLATARERRTRRSNEPLVGKRELAAHLQVSPRTVERYLTEDRYVHPVHGRIPFHRIFGSPYRFKLSEIDAWLEKVEASRS